MKYIKIKDVIKYVYLLYVIKEISNWVESILRWLELHSFNKKSLIVREDNSSGVKGGLMLPAAQLLLLLPICSCSEPKHLRIGEHESEREYRFRASAGLLTTEDSHPLHTLPATTQGVPTRSDQLL